MHDYKKMNLKTLKTSFSYSETLAEDFHHIVLCSQKLPRLCGCWVG